MKISFIGQVHPIKCLVSIPGRVRTTYTKASAGFDGQIVLDITDSNIEAECDFPNGAVVDASVLLDTVQKLVDTAVNLVAFNKGTALRPIVTSLKTSDGVSSDLILSEARLGGISTAYACEKSDAPPSEQHYFRFLNFFLSDHNLTLALQDLIDAIRYPALATINCARVVESLRSSMSNDMVGKDRRSEWDRFNQQLNLGRTYTKVITENSKDARHGKRSAPSMASTRESVDKCWIIMNRYMEYVKHGRTALPEAFFPTLR